MVIAEIPLWITHGNESESSAVAAAAAVVGGGGGGDSVTAVKSTQAWNVWRSRKKCAIYGLDVHPPLLATAGGDGTVKLWNTNALFAQQYQQQHHQQQQQPTQNPPKRTAEFTNEGAYVSSSSTAGGSSADENEREDHGGEGGPDSPTAMAMNGDASSQAGGSGSSSEVDVHDLNGVVRRKKDGVAGKKNSNNNESNTGTTTGGVGSPTRTLSTSITSPSPARKRHKYQHSRLLCTLSAHTGSSVLAVRFSPSGKYLASAGDDAVVCIYAPTTPGSNHHWSRIKLCRGHALDVVDLAWAPDDSHLVSCSLDRDTPIIVWKLTDLALGRQSQGMICNPYKILGKDIHTSTVKGVAFDPAGSYVASSGDDPAVCIWRAHDDWGLEARIDATSGIFRTWKSTGDDEDTAALSAHQSLFRRLSWSTDGSFVCATNAVVRNKHTASTIAREGWAVSTAKNPAAGAANLVGHKQAVVVSRHAPCLLNANPDSNETSNRNNGKTRRDGMEPMSATLLALGDRKGFITVWSTRQSRPIFKLQCSESKCTVTDLAWGQIPNPDGTKGDIMLLVSLLDGQVVALRFNVPTELGPFLNSKDHARVFQLRYGIDLDDGDYALGTSGSHKGRRLLVGQTTGATNLIENALQMSLEDEVATGPVAINEEPDRQDGTTRVEVAANNSKTKAKSLLMQQEETRGQDGRKRVRPVLMTMASMESTNLPTNETPKSPPVPPPRSDPVQTALDAAETALGAAETQSAQDQSITLPVEANVHVKESSRPERHVFVKGPKIAATIDRLKTVCLPLLEKDFPSVNAQKEHITASCLNITKIPTGSKGVAIPCIDVVIKSNGETTWKDEIQGSTCSALAASNSLIAIGTVDGTVQLLGCSRSTGWCSGRAFRSHPPLIFGDSIVSLHFESDDFLVLSSEGSFSVFAVSPVLTLKYKGSVVPAMNHMALSGGDGDMPNLSRLQITSFGRLLLILSFPTRLIQDTAVRRATSKKGNYGVGGSLQAFVYDRPSELWMRLADSRFALSDFYTSLPSVTTGPLSLLEDAVKLGSLQSSLDSSQRQRMFTADALYSQLNESSGNFVASRSHCEDRMACALALQSETEFLHWLTLYVRLLAAVGDTAQLRILIDLLLGSTPGEPTTESYWWLSSSPTILKLDRKNLIKTSVIVEMSRNRSLQRFTNEIALEVDNLLDTVT